MGERAADQIGESANRQAPDLVEELRWQKRYTNGRVPYTMERAAKQIESLRAALREAERFMAYFAGETEGHFEGSGTPETCLAQIRSALPHCP